MNFTKKAFTFPAGMIFVGTKTRMPPSITGKRKRMIDKRVLLLESVSRQADKLLKAQVKVSEAASPDSGGEIAQSAAIHGIVTRGKGDVNRQLIGQCPDLEVIARCGVGLDNIDVDFATRRGIKVVNAPGSNADTVAEHTLGLMLMLQRHLYPSVAAVKNRDWDFRKGYQGDEIRGKTLGILGMGNIGKKVAKLASVFGMNVIYWDAFPQSLP
jgi:D-3-phosphoglycerate dehydrogenase